MDDFVNSLKELYIKKITTAISPKKLLMFIVLLIGLHTIKEIKIGESFFKEFTKINIQGLFDFDKGIFSETTILNIILAFVGVLVTDFIYKKIKLFFFEKLSKERAFDENVIKLIQNTSSKSEILKNSNEEYKNELNKEIKIRKSNFNLTHSYGEFSLCFFLLGFLSITQSRNFFDIIISMLLLLIILWIQRNSYVFYLKMLVPYLVIKHTISRNDKFILSNKNIFDEKD